MGCHRGRANAVTERKRRCSVWPSGPTHRAQAPLDLNLPIALSPMFGTSGVLFGSVVVWGAAAIWAAGTLTLLISSFAPTEHEGPTRLPAWDGPPPRVSGPYRTASGTGPHNADGPVGPPGASSRRSGLPRPHNQLGSMDRPRPSVRSLHAHLDQRPHLDRRHGASPPGTRPLHWLPFRSPRPW